MNGVHHSLLFVVEHPCSLVFAVYLEIHNELAPAARLTDSIPARDPAPEDIRVGVNYWAETLGSTSIL